jgi:hypothetical protein
MAFASESGHWYLPCGKPFYTIIGKNGKERGVTLRDARPVNAVPSVSAIMKLAPAPQLENWKLNQVIQIAHENPREDTEGQQAYMDRIQRIFRKRGEAIMALGFEIHLAIERAMTDTVWIPRPEASAAIKTLGEWAGNCCWRNEKSFAHPLGYGGKCDAHKSCDHSGAFLVDFKTKDFDGDWQSGIWDSHHMQLAAYRQGFGLLTARCAIIYVSTKVPGLTRLVEAKPSDLDHGWELFKALLEVWKIKNRYDPNLKGTENGERERAITAL